ncbi:Aldo-keto reductase yakc [NADP(+)] [Hypsizygus marmoreus]|uniref:Aldo-keto reductase yakc [NADP(+)] n=1 Tax=Hypsizygus marmoreus TaxID=39966 RepID=A0A369JQN1_HYPMA|nr:Aldo-keto reductase yakc [NADP(+)] [Hypsizygus marmoreus]
MSLQPIPTRKLGKNGPSVSAVGLGAMGMGAFYGKSDEKESLETLTYAADRGVTFWDTAFIYGNSLCLPLAFATHTDLSPPKPGESIIGKWFTETGRRSEIFVATKFAMVKSLTDPTTDSSPSAVRAQFKKSLENLQTNYVDLYYQHRVDPDVPVEVFLETLRPFVESGQIKWIGLSEPSIATLKRAKAVKGIGEKVIAAQMEYSPFELYVEKTGFADAINEAGMAIVAYSPLARGLVTGRYHSPDDFEENDFRRLLPRFTEENFPKNLEVVKELETIAKKYKVTTSQITLAWILAEHPNFIPIPGIRSVARVEENAHAAEIELSPDDVKAIRAVVESAEVHGARYPEAFMPPGDCISLSEYKGEQP